MKVKQVTKEKILAVGAKIVHRKGFHNTGIQEIPTSLDIIETSHFIFEWLARRPPANEGDKEYYTSSNL